MSLVAFALRLVASRLLRGQTWADGNIYNSPIDPVAQWQNEALAGPAKPCIAIYTGKRSAEVVVKATQGKSAQVDMVFNVFLPPSIAIEHGAGEDQTSIVIETSNTGGAMVIDLVSRQIEAAFRFGPDPWRKIWDIFVVSVEDVSSRPLLYEIDKTAQIPCVEVTYRLKVCPDPDFGVALLQGWQLLVDAMAADPDYAETAVLVREAIEAPGNLPDWRKTQAALGLSDASVQSLGIVPLEAGEP